MKKILLIIFTITNIFLISLNLNSFIQQRNIQTFYNQLDLSNNFTPIDLPLTSMTPKEYQEVLKAILETSQELKIPVIRRSAFNGVDYKSPSYNSVYSRVTFEYNDQKSLSENFQIPISAHETYSTYPSLHAKPLKKYTDVDITIMPFDLHSKQTEGTFYIENLDSELSQDFKKQLSSKLNKVFNKHWTSKDFNLKKHIPLTEEFTFSTINNDLINLTIIFEIIVLILLCLSFSYEIGIYKLLGTSIFNIYRKLVFPPLIISFLALSIGWSIWLTYKQEWGLAPDLVKNFFTLAIIELILSLSIFTIFNYIPTSKLLKRLSYSKHIFNSIFIVKSMIFATLILSLSPIHQLISSSVNSISSSTYSAYAEIFPAYNGYNADALVDPTTQGFNLQKNLYPVFDKNGALFIDSAGSEGNNKDLPLRSLVVNLNYLDKFYPNKKILNQLHHNKSKNIIILLPRKYATDKNSIKQNYPNTIIDFIYTDKIFSLPSASGTYTSNYTYINVVTPDNYSTQPYLNLATGAVNDPLKIPLDNHSVLDLYKKYLPTLKRTNFIDNFPNFISCKNVQMEEVKSDLGNIMLEIYPIMVSLGLYLATVISSIYLYMNIYGKNFTVKQTLGFSLFSSSKNYWILWLIQTILSFLILPIFFHMNSPALLLLLAVFDALLSYISIKIFSNQTKRRFIDA